ncbi:MAG TPA: hypothetical protein VFV31_05590 [Chitinophagaceae bacterium]|nr:hypothetical protein [Chitinophagaceae bacterium]
MKKEYWINVKHVDNRMVIFLNGEIVWDSGIVQNDPELNKLIEITEQLKTHQDHVNELIFEGFNDSYSHEGNEDDLNPWHFQYRVVVRTVDDQGKITEERDMLSPYNEKHYSNPNIRAMNNSYQIVYKNNEFKVISNSLVQKFSK